MRLPFKHLLRVLLASAVTLLALVSGAVAYFTATGSGTAAGSVTTLSAPGNVAASVSGTAVTVSWNASTIGGSVAATSYTVERYSSTGTDLGAAGCSPVSSNSGSPNAFGSFTCTDSPSVGTYKYIVTAAYHQSWSSASGFTNTVVVQNQTFTSVSAPTTGSTSTAISPGSITATLSGAGTGAAGTITFTVFGPQSSAPTSCTTGGTTAGTASVSGNGTYSSSVGFTPTAAGTYWWYASYAGDTNDAASNSGCGGGMVSTAVKNTTTTTTSMPSTGTAGMAISASSISATLSGATVGATGTVSFTVFGPQSSAPTACTSGGTTVGTATVSGSNTYSSSASFTPTTAGTYWWYASYSGDGNNYSSATICGPGMSSTVVKNATALTASGPATDTSGTAISASSIGSTLSGATSGASGTITYTVFGPRSSAPTTCTSGGTTVGTATVSGSYAYSSSAGFTPTGAGTYWWYASYSGDSNNSPSNSGCGSGMVATIVYSISSLSTGSGSGTSATTSSFTIQPNTPYLLLISRASASGDSVSSFSSTGLSPSLSTSSFSSVAAQNYNTSDWNFAYYFVSSGSASGSGTITVNFAQSGSTYLDLVAVSGASTSAPVVTGNAGTATGGGTSYPANLPSAPDSSDAGIAMVGSAGDLSPSGPSSSPTMTRLVYSHSPSLSQAVFDVVPANQNETLSSGNSVSWGTLALEISAPLGSSGNATTTTASGPATGPAASPIAAGSISATLSGATSSAGGTITFTVFGPQASAPTSCTTGGTSVGTATVSGNGTYNPSTSFTPASPGTYWWYASYSGDLSSNQSSASACGSGMASTAVGKASPSITVSAPGAGAPNSAVSGSAITSTLSGTLSGATGTITYSVFGPQNTAPTSCTSGGTTVGTSTVSGSGSYTSSAGFTPASAGTYWWYASYGGDSNNAAANSGCGSGMASTYAYSVSSVASATGTSGTSATTSSFTVAPSTTYLLLVFRNGSSGDSVTSISSNGLTPSLSTASFTPITSQTYNSSADYQWAYWITTASSASGSGTITVNFHNGLSGPGAEQVVDLIGLGGNSTTAPIVTGDEATANGKSNTATSQLLNAPSTSDAGLVFLTSPNHLGNSAPTASPAMTNAFFASGYVGVYWVVPATGSSESFPISGPGGGPWGTIGLEIAHP